MEIKCPYLRAPSVRNNFAKKIEKLQKRERISIKSLKRGFNEFLALSYHKKEFAVKRKFRFA